MTEIIRYQGHPTTISMFYSSIFNLVCLILINGLIRRVAPRWVFTQAELITVYIMLNIGAALVGHDSIQILVSLMPYAANFKTPENKWGQLFADKLPHWLTVRDPVAIRHFYQGGQSVLAPENLHAWIVPVLCWSAFIIVLGGMFLCMNVLLRKQWTERERLSYPLVQLPLDMTVEGAPLFREKLLWYGFGIVAAIDIINGLAQFLGVPKLPLDLVGIILQAFIRAKLGPGWPTQLPTHTLFHLSQILHACLYQLVMGFGARQGRRVDRTGGCPQDGILGFGHASTFRIHPAKRIVPFGCLYVHQNAFRFSCGWLVRLGGKHYR